MIDQRDVQLYWTHQLNELDIAEDLMPHRIRKFTDQDEFVRAAEKHGVIVKEGPTDYEDPCTYMIAVSRNGAAIGFFSMNHDIKEGYGTMWTKQHIKEKRL